MKLPLRSLLISTALVAASIAPAQERAYLEPGTRVLMDAHNCYPYNGKFADRIERAIATGTPLAIEQDLYWYTDKATGKSWPVVSHDQPADGSGPVLRQHFFDRIRPIVEQAIRAGSRANWPLVTLNLEFKTKEREHLAAIWNLLGEYEDWLCTAERSSDPDRVMPLGLKPVLVLTGDGDEEAAAFHDQVPSGSRLRVFGAVHVVKDAGPDTPPEKMVPQRATNYRRWWNNPWKVIERGGQVKAGAWTAEDEARLSSMVAYAHRQGFWIRFYTLNGYPDTPAGSGGWSASYNFGSLEQAVERWDASFRAGVDFIATDQYGECSAVLASQRLRAAQRNAH